eukprot:1028783-Ditylum_brightwellii.AAC.1
MKEASTPESSNLTQGDNDKGRVDFLYIYFNLLRGRSRLAGYHMFVAKLVIQVKTIQPWLKYEDRTLRHVPCTGKTAQVTGRATYVK